MSRLHLDDYHAAVSAYLAQQLPWLKSVTDYPEVHDGLATPCAFFGVLDWDRAEDQRMNGQLSLSLNGQLLLVFTADKHTSHRQLRNAAMAASLKIDNAHFGLDIEPAQLIGAEPWAFEPALKQYEVWAVNFKQQVDIGVDDYAAMADFLPTSVQVGLEQVIANE